MTQRRDGRSFRPQTLSVHAGRDPARHHGAVNPPVYHASTILFDSLDALEAGQANKFDTIYYGRIGTPTSHAFEEAVAALEGGHRAIVTASGQNALSTALLAYLSAGDHLLMVDSAYAPTRFFCDSTLTRLGVEVEYYDPLIGSGISDLIRDNTALIYMESPGSVTFEVQDVPAIVAAARAAERPRAAGTPARPATMIDNTWASPLFFRPFDHGVDVSIHAATKYIVGHADAMLGVIDCADEATFQRVKTQAVHLGVFAGPEDMYLGLRGVRTLPQRLRQHQETGRVLADWLQAHPDVRRVLHPALPDHPGHACWARDFHGATGLFGFVLPPTPRPALAAMLDSMDLFGMGFSWGGFESLLLPSNPRPLRSATRFDEDGQVMRLHAGLEDVDDLIEDLGAALTRRRAVLDE